MFTAYNVVKFEGRKVLVSLVGALPVPFLDIPESVDFKVSYKGRELGRHEFEEYEHGGNYSTFVEQAIHDDGSHEGYKGEDPEA